jgi:hypothetical protein
MILDYDNGSTGSLSAAIGFLVLKKELQAKGSKRRLAPVNFAHVVQTHDVDHVTGLGPAPCWCDHQLWVFSSSKLPYEVRGGKTHQDPPKVILLQLCWVVSEESRDTAEKAGNTSRIAKALLCTSGIQRVLCELRKR